MRKDNQRKTNTGKQKNTRKTTKPAETVANVSTEQASVEDTIEAPPASVNAIEIETHAVTIEPVQVDAATETSESVLTTTASEPEHFNHPAEIKLEEKEPVKEIIAAVESYTEQSATPKIIDNEQMGEKKTMSTANSTSENSEVKKAHKTAENMPAVAAAQQKTGSGFASTLATFAFMLSVAAGGGLYWMWQQLKIEKNASSETISTLQKQLEQKMSGTQESIKAEISQTLDSKAQEIQTITQQVEASASEKIAKAQENLLLAQAELGKANSEILETKKRQESLEVSLQGVYSRLGNTSREWVIAEADFLLKVANHRLQLQEDVATAIQALNLADKRLSSLEDPALNEVRNVIAQELVSLQTLPVPDQTGIAMQLTQLQDLVDQLPLNARTQPTHADRKEFQASDAPKLEGWDAVPGAIMDTLKGLVVVSYNDKPVEPLLTPEQIKNLHENLKLKLEEARLVLFRGEQEQYQANMDLAIAWTQKYFNADEVSTKKFIDTLAYLKDKQIDLKVPDISSSLRTLRDVSKRMELNIPSMENNAKSENTTDNVAMN